MTVETGTEPGSERDRLGEDGARIEKLLDEVRAAAGPVTWQRVEELVQRIVGLYGEGLVRVLRHLGEAGALTPDLQSRLGEDEVVSSLLLLHGVHPLPPEERVRRALDALRRSRAGADVLLIGVEDGVPRVRIASSGTFAPSTQQSLEQAIRRVIAEAAPDLEDAVIEGEIPRPNAPEAGLVQLRRPPDAERTS